VLAPVRWLIASAIIAVLFYLWLLWAALLVGATLALPFLWFRSAYMVERHLRRWQWVWERQGIVDMRDWAFARRRASN
jgi:hypothetical protein